MFGINKKVIFFLTLMLLGIAIALQVKSIIVINRQQATVSNIISDYKEQLIKEQEKSEELKAALLENQNKKDNTLKELAD
jgi:PhoPQ-activated pathogenicity-related protein